MQSIVLILGLFIIILIFWDFFHTTISGNGFGLISLYINKSLAKLLLKIGNKSLFHYSGFIHVMISVFSSFLLLLFGTFLVFASGDDMVIHQMTHMPATLPQRFYYTCYLLSTAGFGDFVPGNELSNFLSSIFSFSGFIMLTTAMAYLISVINSVLMKKELALSISSLGENVNELYIYFSQDQNMTALIEKSGHLRQMINRNTSSFTTFPVIRFFLTRKKRAALVLQLATLYEVLTVLKKQTESDSVPHLKINRILKSIEYYLQLEEKTPLTYSYDEDKLGELRVFWQKHHQVYDGNATTDKALSTALHKAGWDWEDVYRK